MSNQLHSTETPGATRPWTVITHSDGLKAEMRRSQIDGSRPLTPLQLAARFSPADLPGQFVLARSDDAVPSGWVVHRHRGWTLGAHPWLPVTKIVATDGLEVGWLLGSAIDEHAEFIEQTARVPFASDANPGAIESWLYRLCGRYVAIWLSPTYERVYLDAGGMLPVVFAPGQDRVASTTSLIPYDGGNDDDLDLLRAARIPADKVVLAFGMTSRYGVARLHPNHYLDLNQWKPRRHWPSAPLDNCVDPLEAIHIVSRLIARHVAASARRGSIQLALTAGSDSRAILACSREYLHNIELFTLAIPDRVGRLDVDVATRIADRHGLSHHVLPYVPPTRQDLESWLWRSGFSLADPRGWHNSPTYRQLDANNIEISGVGGEAARVAYWRDCGSGQNRVTPRVLADCLQLPHHAGVLANIRTWMSSYPASTPVQLVDGFFLEQAMGAWAGNLAYGDAHSVRCRLYPFVSREALDVMSRLPESYKLARRFQSDLIRYHWPELLRAPFNRRAGFRRYADRIRRRAWLMRAALAGTASHS